MTRAKAKQLRQLIEQLAAGLDDATALTGVELFPAWRPGMDCKAGDRVQHRGVLYKVLQAHTSQADWVPGEGTESLYTRIDETHAGTLTDPIPYSGNMALEAGKYYSQGGAVYLCTRDTVNPVYNALADLVGLYVEKEA